ALAEQHPARLRNAGDKAKLISSNDSSGFTFRGRFTDKEQAISVGHEISQKAHSALRWLIGRQGYRHDTQVFIAWAVSGKQFPSPFGELGGWGEWNDDEVPEPETVPAEAPPDHTRDLGQSFARRLNVYMAGYGEIDNPTEDIVVMGLDSATTGRMAITYYRELKGAEFLERLRRWHTAMAWPQRFSRKETDAKGKSKPVVGWSPAAPAPDTISVAAYGRRLDDKLRKATVERLIPCVIDGRPLPRDLMEACAHRVIHRSGQDSWEWELSLGVACALFKGFYETHPDSHQRRSYAMALEPTRTSRDYLFGRLLAIAENIEQKALKYADEKERPTNAERLMQHFAMRPASAWLNIRLALEPYLERLRSSSPGLLKIRKDLLDDVTGLFQPDDFTDDSRRLSPEFLLGYHCQRLDFRYKPGAENATDAEGDKA
ncbi:MAG: type I-C CRISPR-associated protein Cas8c/Csd1, partial [Pseudomonadota bacterium]